MVNLLKNVVQLCKIEKWGAQIEVYKMSSTTTSCVIVSVGNHGR
jgi:hypothetical protein